MVKRVVRIVHFDRVEAARVSGFRWWQWLLWFRTCHWTTAPFWRCYSLTVFGVHRSLAYRAPEDGERIYAGD